MENRIRRTYSFTHHLFHEMQLVTLTFTPLHLIRMFTPRGSLFLYLRKKRKNTHTYTHTFFFFTSLSLSLFISPCSVSLSLYIYKFSLSISHVLFFYIKLNYNNPISNIFPFIIFSQ